MLWTLFVILSSLWLMGVVSPYAFVGFVNIVLLVALTVVLIKILQDRKVIG